MKKEIGCISGCIGYDLRYLSRVLVYLHETGDKVSVVLEETGPVGGMDGPDGVYPVSVAAKYCCGASPKEVVATIKRMFDNPQECGIIKKYGKPNKNFYWRGTKEKGLSAAKCRAALEWANSSS